MRVHHHRIRLLDPLGHVAHFRADQRRPCPCRIHMGKQAFGTRHRQHLIQPVTDTDTGCAQNGHQRTGQMASRPVRINCCLQGIHAHGAVIIDCNFHQIFTPDP